MFVVRVSARPVSEWWAQHLRQRRHRLSSVDHDAPSSSGNVHNLPAFAIPSAAATGHFQGEEQEIVVFEDEPEVELGRTNSHDNGDLAIHRV